VIRSRSPLVKCDCLPTDAENAGKKPKNPKKKAKKKALGDVTNLVKGGHLSTSKEPTTSESPQEDESSTSDRGGRSPKSPLIGDQQRSKSPQRLQLGKSPRQNAVVFKDEPITKKKLNPTKTKETRRDRDQNYHDMVT